LFIGIAAFYNLESAGGTERNAAVAVYAFRVIANHFVYIGDIFVRVVRALPFTGAADDAPVIVPQHLIFGV